MPGKRQATDKAADAATDNAQTAAPDAATDTEGTNVPTDNNAADAAPVTPPAVLAARQNVSQIEAALAVLGAGNPAAAALQAALIEAQGAEALAVAQAASDAAKAAQIEAAQAAASAHNLPQNVLTAMLAAIEAEYAPAPAPEPEAAPEAEAAPQFGRKQPSPRTLANNAAAVAALAGDYARPAASLAAFKTEWSDLNGVNAVAGTRYASLVALAGDGVTGEADYKSLTAQVRHYLLSLGYTAGGASYASLPWLLAAGPHAPGADKGADSLPLKFVGGAALALLPNGRFALARPGTPNVRYLARDAAALAAFRSGQPAAAAPAAPQAPTPPSAPLLPLETPGRTVPTAPNAIALPNGGVARTARCQHCSGRNIVGASECAACGEADWQVA